jgi:hypothetical protein
MKKRMLRSVLATAVAAVALTLGAAVAPSDISWRSADTVAGDISWAAPQDISWAAPQDISWTVPADATS